MLAVQQSLKDGELDAALQQTQQDIRRNPADPKLRILLFQLYCILGSWDKALNQLNVLRDLDASSLLMVGTYEQVLQCEAFRKAVFAGQKTPLIFGQPQQWLALLLDALRLECEGQHNAAAERRQEALEQAPATKGKLNDVAFAWLADADPRLGPVLEAMVNGRYYWIPFANIQKIDIEKPSDLRDLVWLPAVFTWKNGGQATGFIPSRYPGSECIDDNRIRLCRMTDWRSIDGGADLGVGQRLLATDVDDYALLDIRQIEFETADQD